MWYFGLDQADIITQTVHDKDSVQKKGFIPMKNLVSKYIKEFVKNY